MSIVRSSWPCFFVCFRGESRLRMRRGFRLCGGEAAGFPIAPATPLVRSPINLYHTQRRQGAAALSAAVTTTKFIGERTYAQAEPPMQRCPAPTPATLRERGSGGEALLLEKRPLPQHLPYFRITVIKCICGRAKRRRGATEVPTPLLTRMCARFASYQPRQ